MNPNLAVFLKRSLVFSLIVAGFGLGIFFLRQEGILNFEVLGTYLMKGLLGFMVTVMSVLMVGVILRLTWTGIMNRADAIQFCCPDTNGDGIHLITTHYHAGGESSEGFNTFSHYFIVLSEGKAFLSKKVKDEGNDITQSLTELNVKTTMQLCPDKSNAVSVGSNTSGDNIPTNVITKICNGTLEIKGYDGLIDYGFKLKFTTSSGRAWTMRL
jgi:hypothetical protein